MRQSRPTPRAFAGDDEGLCECGALGLRPVRPDLKKSLVLSAIVVVNVSLIDAN